MNLIRNSLTLLILMNLLFSQTEKLESLTKSAGSYQPVYRDLSDPAIPLEGVIDPSEYYLGPGDQLHVVVTSKENKLLPGQAFDLFNAETVEYFVYVGPSGELSLPSIGQFSTQDKTYQQIKDEIIASAKSKSYKDVITTVQLAALRSFKIKIFGAVENPGYVTVSSIARVRDAIRAAKGVQKYGSNEIIFLERDGERKELHLKKFLLEGDISQNPNLKEGDIIIVPFVESTEKEKLNFTEYKTHQVIVHGFVRGPRGYPYVPGYRSSDYIAMVGGTLNIGSIGSTIIYRSDGTVLKSAYDEFVEPGDVIVVPESLRSQLFGNISILQTATAIATLWLTYKAAIGG